MGSVIEPRIIEWHESRLSKWKWGTRWPRPRRADLEDGPGARLDDAQLLVLAAGGQQAAVGVEGHAEDDVRVAVDHFHRLADLQVPDQDLREGLFGNANVIDQWEPK